MTNINLEKVAKDFAGAIVFDGANSFIVIQASEFICFSEMNIELKGEVGQLLNQEVIYETTETSEPMNPDILNKESINVSTLYHNFTEKLSDLTEYEKEALLNKISLLNKQ